MKKLFLLIIAATSAVALTACGGGGGGGSAAPSPSGGSTAITPNLLPELQRVINEDPAEARDGLYDAADETPFAGSVNQNDERATLSLIDSVSVTRSGNYLTIPINIEGDEVLNLLTERLIDRRTIEGESEEILGSDFRFLDYVQEYTALAPGERLPATLYARFYSDIDDSGIDTDYLSGGLWLTHIVYEGESDIEWGAFADSNLAPSTNLPTTGSATYSGGAAAFYLDDSDTLYNLYGEVNMQATWGATSAISIESTASFSDAPGYSQFEVRMEATGANNGFFTGDTQVWAARVGSSFGEESGFTGQWGGQFYGDNEASAAGTFGASETIGSDPGERILGIWGVRKE